MIMKKNFGIRLLVIIFVITLNFCKRDYVEYNTLAIKEREILTKVDTFFPPEITDMVETSFTEISQENRAIMLDSLNLALDSLMITISATSGMEEYKKIMSNTLANFNNSKNSQNNECLGLSYTKSVGLTTGVTGTVGAAIIAELGASAGGGINMVYDFVNLDRQIYCYKVCTYNFSFGLGAGAAFSAGVGFTGLRKLTTGIRYHGSTSGINKFAGLSLGQSYSVSAGIMAILGLSPNIGVGTTQSAVGSFSQDNLYPCPENLTLIENGARGFYFQVSGNLSIGAGADILLAFKIGRSGSQSKGITNSYTNFSNVRLVAGTRMARELLLGMPIAGIECGYDPIDIPASCLAIIYSLKQFDQCPAEVPSIGTTAIENITSTTAIGGGVITDMRGSDISARGLCWSVDKNPTINDNHTNNGTGVGSYSGNLTGLVGGVKYHVRAYATNSAGTGYGADVKFTTQSGGGLPVSAFSANPTSGNKPLIVNFADQSTNSPTSWQWNFGDGNTSTQQSPTHTYQNAGSYTVQLAVTNSDGSDTEMKNNYITVTNAGSAPVADFNGNPTSGNKPLIVNFTDQSTNSPTNWEWDFGDGGTSTVQNPTHTYQNEGYYAVTLTVNNGFDEDTEVKNNYINVTSGGGTGTFTDPRDGETYATVDIGNQTWFAENLNYTTTLSWTYGDEPANGDIYGRLYTWNVALVACPSGWHLPSDEEWKNMEMALGMSQSEVDAIGLRGADQGTQMKSISGWLNNGNGTNSSGFNALPGGGRGSDGLFYNLGSSGNWWSSSDASGAAWTRYLVYEYGGVGRLDNNKSSGSSVRCLKD